MRTTNEVADLPSVDDDYLFSVEDVLKIFRLTNNGSLAGFVKADGCTFCGTPKRKRRYWLKSTIVAEYEKRKKASALVVVAVPELPDWLLNASPNAEFRSTELFKQFGYASSNAMLHAVGKNFPKYDRVVFTTRGKVYRWTKDTVVAEYHRRKLIEEQNK